MGTEVAVSLQGLFPHQLLSCVALAVLNINLQGAIPVAWHGANLMHLYLFSLLGLWLLAYR